MGMSLSPPAVFAFAYVSGSVPPTSQNTEGTFHSAPKQPESSLADVGKIFSTRPSAK